MMEANDRDNDPIFDRRVVLERRIEYLSARHSLEDLVKTCPFAVEKHRDDRGRVAAKPSDTLGRVLALRNAYSGSSEPSGLVSPPGGKPARRPGRPPHPSRTRRFMVDGADVVVLETVKEGGCFER